jgi:photosystem II stability/assembly factor-like uncharacterized protein
MIQGALQRWSRIVVIGVCALLSCTVPVRAGDFVAPAIVERWTHDQTEEASEAPLHILSRDEMRARAAGAVDQAPLGPVAPLRVAAFPGLNWAYLGPQPMHNQFGDFAGRICDIATHPTQPGTAYIAAAQGGVWRTKDFGQTWTPLTDHLPSLASGAIAVVKNAPNRIYYITGEQHYSIDGFFGDGLFMSADSGASWSKVASASTVGEYCSRVIVRGGTPDTIYVASNFGVARSTNGGTSWVMVLSLPNSSCNQLLIDPSNSQRLYAFMSDQGIYKTINRGVTWTKLAGGLPTTGFGTGTMAISESNPSVLIASFSNTSSALLGIWKTTDAGVTWTTKPAPNYLGGQGPYDNAITIDPGNPNVWIAGGQQDPLLMRTVDSGDSWQSLSGNLHADVHALAWGTDHRLWMGCDGGMWSSPDLGDNWTNLNATLGTIQFYSAAVHPFDPNRALGGTQDDGSMRFDGAPTWVQRGGNDGSACAFEWDSPNIYYTATQAASDIDKYDEDTYLGNVVGPWGSDRRDWGTPPFVTDPNRINTLYMGTQRVWRTTNSATSWSPISGDLTNGSGVLRAICVTPQGFIYTASNDGAVHFSADGFTWFRRDATLPQGAFVAMAVDPFDYHRAYLARQQASGQRLFRTLDGGVTWSDITGTLPAGTWALSLAVDFRPVPRRIYLGTYYGVYSSEDEGATWRKEDQGLPNLAVYQLVLDPVNDYLYAATHGRGMWRAAVPQHAVYCRINCGGPTIASTDAGPDWSADTGASPSGFVNAAATGNATGGTGNPIDVTSPTLPPGVPPLLFTDERYDPPGAAEMKWVVPAQAGPVQLRLYFTEIYDAIVGPGQRVFDVDVNNVPVLQGVDIWSLAGQNKAYMKTVYVTSEGSTMVIDFHHGAENPCISAIEVLSANDGITAVPGAPRAGLTLRQNAPNPFRGATTVRFTLSSRTHVRLNVFDVAGHLVSTLVDGNRDAGEYAVAWDGRDRDARRAPAGVYLCCLASGDGVFTRRMVLVK